MSLGFHTLLAAALLLFVRSKPVNPSPDTFGAVELLMVEKKGSGQPVPPAQPQTQAPPIQSKPDPADTPKAATVPPAAASDAKPTPQPPTPSSAAVAPPHPDDAGEPVSLPPGPAAQQPDQVAETSKPVPAAPPRPTPLKMNLDGTDSDSNAIVMGKDVIPASPDDRFRNRPPVYPFDAELRGEHGIVVVIIHVSEQGTASGVDIEQSSGVTSLDRAAIEAVRSWHFHPALKDGHTVPFDMPIQVTFEAN